MLNDKEIKKINESADTIVEVLKRLPNVDGAGKTFNFSNLEQPDPLRFICEGAEGGYILEFGLELIKDRIDHIDLLGSVLHIQIMEQQIYPTSDWKCFDFTSSSGLEESNLQKPQIKYQHAS